jgi:8-oxo-dGTP pyrophosphatase MutT (NUDIX family)
VKKVPIRTARCLIRREGKFLLVVHRGARSASARPWALPGGRVEPGESPEQTARREIREEIGITLGDLREVGTYRYKGWFHRVLGADHPDPILWFRRAELLKIGWHTPDEIVALARAGALHAGYEHLAVADFLGVS